MSPCRMPFFLLFLLSLASVITSIEATAPTLVLDHFEENGRSLKEEKTSQESLMVPLREEKFVMMMNETRRKLNSFQICALCTCCGGAKGLCLPSPCCYAINCNIPHRPFGFCSFTPRTCNCFGCHL